MLFRSDCLETLEEIGIRGRETFIQAGSQELQLIPSPNSDLTWVNAVVAWIQNSSVLETQNNKKD